MTEQYRASFDAVVKFINGGGLNAEGFRVDVPDQATPVDTIRALFIASLGLLMTETVTLNKLVIFPEPHKGTCGGPSDHNSNPVTARYRHVDLSHSIRTGMVTYPGLPAPEIRSHLGREESRAHYSNGTEFAIDHISMVGNTGTYLDSPFHRYDKGIDLAQLPLASLVDLPTVVVRSAEGCRAIDVGQVAAYKVAGCAVLLHTGADRHWESGSYVVDAPYLTAAAARWLAENGAVLVGIDSVNIDDLAATDRPSHSVLLAAGIPIVEHLTGLSQLPPLGARFTAAPPRVTGMGTFPVRAHAAIPVS